MGGKGEGVSAKARFLVVLFLGTLALVGLTLVQAEKHEVLAAPKKKSELRWPLRLHRLAALFAKPEPTIRQLAGLHEYPPPLGPDQCHCPGESQTAAGSWNRCLSCLYVSFMDLHNGVAKEFSPLLDPTDDFSGSAEVGGAPLNVMARSSSLPGYARHLQLSRPDGGICLNLHLTRDEKFPARLRALLQLDSEMCPSDGSTGSHAIAMKLDLGLTDPEREVAELFHAGEYEGNGFSVTSDDADDLFYLRVESGPRSGKRVTTSWAFRATQNQGWKYFLNGEDDVLLYIATRPNLPLNDASRTAAGLSIECVDDRNDRKKALGDCEKQGFGFAEFPLSLRSMSSLGYPKWTAGSARLEKELGLLDYFLPEKR